MPANSRRHSRSKWTMSSIVKSSPAAYLRFGVHPRGRRESREHSAASRLDPALAQLKQAAVLCREIRHFRPKSHRSGWLTRSIQSKRCRRLKADKPTVTFERTAESKIRVTTTSWDDAKVILPNQVLEVATIGKQVGLVRVDKPIAYLDIDDAGLVEADCSPETN
jgi:hypothetical protein